MVRILLALTVVLGVFVSIHAPVNASSGDEPVPTEVPVVTANPFLPEDADLTSCVGMLQRPGCGSEERGGWHQYLVAAVLVGGLLIVFGRVAWGVRQSQKRHTEPTSD